MSKQNAPREPRLLEKHELASFSCVPDERDASWVRATEEAAQSSKVASAAVPNQYAGSGIGRGEGSQESICLTCPPFGRTAVGLSIQV